MATPMPDYRSTADETRDHTRRALKALMGWHDVSEVELAAALGLSRQAINNRLIGKTPIRSEEVGFFARFFDAPVEVFYADRPEDVIRSRCQASGAGDLWPVPDLEGQRELTLGTEPAALAGVG